MGGAGGGPFGLAAVARGATTRTSRGARTTFADVAASGSQAELVEIVDFLRDPAVHTRLGGGSKGVLLVGAPGAARRWREP